MGTDLVQDLFCTVYKSPHQLHTLRKKHKINKDAARHGAEPQPDASQQDTRDLKKQSHLFRSDGPQG